MKQQNNKYAFFFFNLFRTASIYSRTDLTRTISPSIQKPYRWKKRCMSAISFHSVWLWTWPRVGREARGQHSEARVHAAERRSRKASCQPPAEGKTMGHQPERFAKRTSQGRFQLAQHLVTAVRGGGRRQPWA